MPNKHTHTTIKYSGSFHLHVLFFKCLLSGQDIIWTILFELNKHLTQIFHLTQSCYEKITETLRALSSEKVQKLLPQDFFLSSFTQFKGKKSFFKSQTGLLLFMFQWQELVPCSHLNIREAKSWSVDRCPNNKGRVGFQTQVGDI